MIHLTGMTMNAGTLQTLELIGWGVLMYWLLSATKSARKTAEDARVNTEKTDVEPGAGGA